MMRYKENVSRNNDLNEIAKEIEDMTAKQNVTAGITANNAHNIQDLLDDLDLDVELSGSNEIEEIVAEDETLDAASDMIEDLSDSEIEETVDIDNLDLALQRHEAYEEQVSEIETVENASEAIAEQKAQKPKQRGAKTGQPAAPRVARNVGDLEASNFVLEGDPATMSLIDLDEAKAEAIKNTPAQKKIAEKYENLFVSLSQNRQPSVYVVAAYKLLADKKTVSSADIVAMFKASGHTQGTAQSQAGQIMTLFDAVKIASRSKNTLTLNDNSRVAERLSAIINNAAA